MIDLFTSNIPPVLLSKELTGEIFLHEYSFLGMTFHAIKVGVKYSYRSIDLYAHSEEHSYTDFVTYGTESSFGKSLKKLFSEGHNFKITVEKN